MRCGVWGIVTPLGLAFDGQGKLWEHEMGPRHGDEVNLVQRGQNYGYPAVSEGDHYSGEPIPDHNTRPDFTPPAVAWVPAISPAGFMIYDGAGVPAWAGNGFIGGLSSRALVRVHLDAATNSAREVERYEWGARIREIEQGLNGEIYVLEDGNGGRLLRIEPR